MRSMEGVPTHKIAIDKLTTAENWVNILTESGIFPSKSEAKKMMQGGGVSINKEKLNDILKTISKDDILHNKYVVVQKGKNKNFLLILN
jgi:tyrosyl-tRNA synthetase